MGMVVRPESLLFDLDLDLFDCFCLPIFELEYFDFDQMNRFSIE